LRYILYAEAVNGADHKSKQCGVICEDSPLWRASDGSDVCFDANAKYVSKMLRKMQLEMRSIEKEHASTVETTLRQEGGLENEGVELPISVVQQSWRNDLDGDWNLNPNPNSNPNSNSNPNPNRRNDLDGDWNETSQSSGCPRIPYFLAKDDARQEFVLSVRGTRTARDAVVDLKADVEVISKDLYGELIKEIEAWEGCDGGEVEDAEELVGCHSGMLFEARGIPSLNPNPHPNPNCDAL